MTRWCHKWRGHRIRPNHHMLAYRGNRRVWAYRCSCGKEWML